MNTPINNLDQSGFEPSSVQPGVSGESVNAPYGPKAADECGIDSVHDEYATHKPNVVINHDE